MYVYVTHSLTHTDNANGLQLSNFDNKQVSPGDVQPYLPGSPVRMQSSTLHPSAPRLNEHAFGEVSAL
jgi:hypothetical protein